MTHAKIRHVIAPVCAVLGPLLGPARAEDAGALLKSRERAFLLGAEPQRATLLPGQAPVIAPAPEDQIAAGTALPKSLSVSIGDLAERVGGAPSPLSSGVLDFWVEGHYEPYDVGSLQRSLESGAMSLVSAGTSYKLGPDIMIGALASLDQGSLSEQRFGSEAETSGWAAGPFASVRFGSGVVFDGRAAWGDGSLEQRDGTSPASGADFGRRLVKGTLRGTRDVAGWSLTPMVGFTLVEETLVGQTAVLNRDGRVEVTPELKRRMALSSRVYMEPSLAAGAFIPLGSEQGAASPFIMPSAADVHLKASAGLALGATDGITVKAQGGVETAGPELPGIWSGRLQLDMPLGGK